MTESPLQDAIESRDFRAARRLAVKTDEVPLQEALALTLLAAETEPELYEEMARRWLARYVCERAPQPSELQAAAQILARVSDGSLPSTEARPALAEFVSEMQ